MLMAYIAFDGASEWFSCGIMSMNSEVLYFPGLQLGNLRSLDPLQELGCLSVGAPRIFSFKPVLGNLQKCLWCRSVSVHFSGHKEGPFRLLTHFPVLRLFWGVILLMISSFRFFVLGILLLGYQTFWIILLISLFFFPPFFALQMGNNFSLMF